MKYESIINAIATETGRRPSSATVTRWRTKGVKGVRLNATRIGGRWWTTREDVVSFIASLNKQKTSVSLQNPTLRKREIDREVAAAMQLKRSKKD